MADIELGIIRKAKYKGDAWFTHGIREIAATGMKGRTIDGPHWIEAARSKRKWPLLKGDYTVTAVSSNLDTGTKLRQTIIDNGKFRSIRAALKAGMQEVVACQKEKDAPHSKF